MIAALAAFAGMSTTAYSADLDRGGSLKDAPAAYDAPVFAWTGLYIGGSVGFGAGDTSGTPKFDHGGKAFDDLITSLFSTDYDVDGAIYGAHVGYNIQRDSNWVYGVELGLNGTDIDGSQPILAGILQSERELDWYATAVGRLGYASGRTLFYGFGGVAWGKVETTISLLGHEILNGDETHVGWTAGVGIEHAFTDRFSARIEYSHVDLGEEDHALAQGLSSEVDLDFDAIKIGASYKLFDGYHSLEASK
nr:MULTISPECIES: outer membrane beta-barrel protein [Rhodomicrobium]